MDLGAHQEVPFDHMSSNDDLDDEKGDGADVHTYFGGDSWGNGSLDHLRAREIKLSKFPHWSSGDQRFFEACFGADGLAEDSRVIKDPG